MKKKLCLSLIGLFSLCSCAQPIKENNDQNTNDAFNESINNDSNEPEENKKFEETENSDVNVKQNDEVENNDTNNNKDNINNNEQKNENAEKNDLFDNPFSGIDVLYKVPEPRPRYVYGDDASKEAYDAFNNKIKNIIAKTSEKSVEKLERFLVDSKKEDMVVSPASLLLAAGGLSAVSDNFNDASFGLENSAEDINYLLRYWNLEEYERGYFWNNETEDFLELRQLLKSCVLHQQVGEHYAFDEEKRNNVNDDYISTMVSSSDSRKKDADSFFKNGLGMNIEVPDSGINSGVITYGALKLVDSPNMPFYEEKNFFNFEDGKRQIDTFSLGYEDDPSSISRIYYYNGENYEAFKFDIAMTDMLIILPNEGIDINTINVAKAYKDFMANNEYRRAVGYVPYFHNCTNSLNVTSSIMDSLNGNEVFYSKLLKDDVFNDLDLYKVLQTNDFNFNKNGVTGESITEIALAGSIGPGIIENLLYLNVDRPFYAFSLYEDFPLFINKVTNPGK